MNIVNAFHRPHGCLFGRVFPQIALSCSVQEQAAITLLSLVTNNNEMDEEASIEANRLGAGSIVTDMLNPPPYQKSHASVLPLWNVLTISEMCNRNKERKLECGGL